MIEMSTRTVQKRKSTPDDLITFHLKSSNLVNGFQSDVQNCSGFPWKIVVQIDKDTTYGDTILIVLHSAMNGHSNLWFCDVSLELILINQKDSTQSVSKKIDQLRYDNTKTNFHGFCSFSMGKLLNPDEGFIKDDTVLVDAKITVMNSSLHKKFRPKTTFDMLSPSTFSDGILVVKGTKFYVNKQILALQSPFFDRLFNGTYDESKQEEIEIKDVSKRAFSTLIRLMYPLGEGYTGGIVESVLELADRFEVNTVLDKAESFLLQNDKIEESKKLLLADKYILNVLLDKCLAMYTTREQIQKLKLSEDYPLLSDATTVTLLEKFMTLCECGKH